MKKNRPERRMHNREMRVDRRKSDEDLVEHVIRGIRRSQLRSTSDDRAPSRVD